jgi:hypothetical protein
MKFAKDFWKLLPLIMILLGSLTIVRAVDLSPLPNATVTASGDNGDGFSITGSDGTFTISHGLGEGNYTIDVGHEGYISAEINTTITAGAETNIGDVQSQAEYREPLKARMAIQFQEFQFSPRMS